MDFSSADWLRELEMEDLNLVPQCEVNSSSPSHSVDEFLLSSFSPESYSPCISLNDMDAPPTETSPRTHLRPQVGREQLISDRTGSSFDPENSIMDEPFPCSHFVEQPTMQFDENPNSGCVNSNGSDDNLSDTLEGKRVNQPTSRASMQAKNHVMAERKRRERLNQKLISLAALLPGLKKMDKASVLGDAIKYIKQLEERVQTLEAEVQKSKEEPTVRSIKRSRLSGDDDSSSSNEESDGNFDKPLPDIQARISHKNVLVIRVQHKKQDGFIEKVLSQVQILRLNVITSSVITLGDTILDITVLAQMADGFFPTAKDVVRNLRSQLAVLS